MIHRKQRGRFDGGCLVRRLFRKSEAMYACPLRSSIGARVEAVRTREQDFHVA